MISSTVKLPRPVFDTVYAFSPNRDTLGGTAYLLVEETGNILVDCPSWEGANAEFLQTQGVRWLVITHRGGMGKVREIQAALGCEVVVQEQEAYLLPGLAVTSFEQEFRFSESCYAFWTCGHSPGSACVYSTRQGGILFTGRHLLPDRHAAASLQNLSLEAADRECAGVGRSLFGGDIEPHLPWSEYGLFAGGAEYRSGV
jgi:glyoxylase-like metal-dependent hydrolase (beta-lactamase superfamily II)